MSDFVLMEANWGTLIPREIGRSSPQAFAQGIELRFAAAIDRVVNQLQENEYTDQPADERLARITLLSWAYTPDRDGIVATLRATAQSGERQEIILPLNTSFV